MILPLSLFIDEDGCLIIGFCLWCNRDFYSLQEAEAHIYDGSGACPMLREMSREPSMPPLLQILLDGRRLTNRFAKNYLIGWEKE
jgi:hypothetical protein